MTNLIERIARAKAARCYAERLKRRADDLCVVEAVERDWRRFAADIRETLEALREPSEAMIDAGWDAVEGAFAVDLPVDPATYWRAMIDQVLRDESHRPGPMPAGPSRSPAMIPRHAAVPHSAKAH
jgi:hypothetical protein